MNFREIFLSPIYTRLAVILFALSLMTFLVINKILEFNEFLAFTVYATWTLVIFLVGNHYVKPSVLMEKLNKIWGSAASRERKMDKYEKIIDEACEKWHDTNQALNKKDLKKRIKDTNKELKKAKRVKIR